MPDQEHHELVAAAVKARETAYAPYSNFRVGAAVRTVDGEVFTGANVENASYGLTICAERVAVSIAVAAGKREFQALAIATSGGAPPCGACRQFVAEFCDDLTVLVVDVDREDDVTETRLAALLPGRFSLGK